MAKITAPDKIRQLTLLCALTYFVSYLTRINYAAVVSAYVAQEGVAKELAALPITLQSISYGLGQLFSGYLGDRIQPKKIITGGLILTTLMNFSMPLANNITLMSTFWCINGLAQAMMWPPLVKITTSAFDDAVFRKACVVMSYGSSGGTIAVYLLGPALLSFSGWQTIFWVCGACSAVMVILWNIGIRQAEAEGMEIPLLPAEKKQKNTAAPSRLSAGLLLPLVVIMAAIICQGMIRDGVTTWMPSYVAETYQLGSSVSILTGVVLPVFSIVSFKVAEWVNKRLLPNELTCAAVFAGAATVASAILALASDASAVLSVVMSGVIVAAMCGVNLMLVCILPGAFSRHGNVSTISGILNFSAYVGSAISSYTTASIASNLGWGFTIWTWAGISAAATVLCIGCIRFWRRFRGN